MRNTPTRVHRIAEKTPFDMIVQPSLRNRVQRRLQYFTDPCARHLLVAVKEIPQLRHMRKPALIAKPTLKGIRQSNRHLLEGLTEREHPPGCQF